MPTALRPIAWLGSGLAALVALGVQPVSAQEPAAAGPMLIAAETGRSNDGVAAQTAESVRQDRHLLRVKHIDPDLPATELVAELEPAPVKQVLIATETSRFKEEVVAQVAETLSQDKPPLLVKRIDLNRLAAEPIRNYQAIVLVNSCRAWRPSSAVLEFLKSMNEADKKKLVVLTTANSAKCDLGVAGVDAISAASKRTGTSAVSQAVVDKVHARLAAP